jgi:Flp pilus assembly protein TadD
MNPTSPSDWNDLGVLEARLGDKAAAHREFEHALALEPNNQAALNNLRHL